MSPYQPLAKGSVRLLRLLPHQDENSRIECQLITISQLGSRSSHPYEALSYVWGPENDKKSIYIDGKNKLDVTANLYVALLHLRHRFVERILWIDAICVNQKDDIEKGHQVESMAKIYAKASRVLVWLGETADNSNQALEAIRVAAEKQYKNSVLYPTNQQANLALSDQQAGNSSSDETNQDAILTLLDRQWFQRIWVVQEVAAAQHILIKCGSAEIDGSAFCSGLSVLKPFDGTRPDLQTLIPPIAHLMRGTIFRRRHARDDDTGRLARFSLNIGRLGELVDMYHTRKATIPLDKVYALLGMSSDEPYKVGIEANYKSSWKEVFQKLVNLSLSNPSSRARGDYW
ncbi:heterokaryon incompatibility protein-domain-containing protein [Ilyonectria sp. MPI-CAGE-AT-0026]|nr:heterokaryon incompatibility protein-domain-containing protein [Ilyonectria sp. MPI-CAGE-AT-0026]